MEAKKFFSGCWQKLKKFFSNRYAFAAVAAVLALAIGLGIGLLAFGKKDKSESSATEPTVGLGVFYYDNGVSEYQISFADDNVVTFLVQGQNKVGTYTLDGNTVKLDLGAEENEVTATLDNDVLTLTYGESEMRFFKKIEYTVSFEENGGSEVADATIINGKTMAKPGDPQKDGYQFLGWYADSEYTTPYMFGTQLVTSDMTLYAQWALVEPGKAEFVIDFDLGYEGEAPAAMNTIGGKLYNAPTVEREGYNFSGWWISMYESADKLTYQWSKDTVFDANTTLYALWESADMGSKLPAPQVEVTGNSIRWNGIQGVSIYKVKVTGPQNFQTIEEDVSATNFTVDFANSPAGDYQIEVTAVASNTNNNSDTVTRTYKNKALSRVSQFSVLDGSVLIYNGVENAERYYITVDCGEKSHSHTMYDNGSSTNYNFANCTMQEGGITFVVTATADGYASSESETFVYNRMLDKVMGLAVDDETQTLSWYPVANATNYVVSILCGDSMHTHEVVDNGSKTSYNLKECPAGADGTIKINVYAKTKGFNSPEATEYSYAKTMLASPSNISLDNVKNEADETYSYMLTWKAVVGATAYDIKIGNTIVTVTTNSYDLTTALTWVEGADYLIEIKAKNDSSESAWSDSVNARYMSMYDSLKYQAGVVSWRPVLGATAYEVRINSGNIQTVDNGNTFVEVTLTRAGYNKISVRSFDESNYMYSDWVSIEVYANTITFDSREGTGVDAQYKVAGDKFVMPESTRDGYDFGGWYNTPSGPEGNGAKYSDGYFTDARDLVLYAYWTPAKYTLTYVVGEGAEMAETTAGVYYTKDYTLSVPNVTDKTKVFVGWFVGTNAASQQLTDDRGNSLKAWDIKGGLTVYAQYVSNVLSFTKLLDGTYSVSKGVNINKVTSVTIPQTYTDPATGVEGLVTVVDGYAFEICTKLVSITIPDTVKIIAEETAFYRCTKLEEINVVHVDGNNTAVYSSHDGVLLHVNEITGQTELCYYPLARTGSYEIPEGVTEIPLKLFAESPVTEVIIPTSVVVIRESAFFNCSKLSRVTFASGGTDPLTVENEAFKKCTALETITLPSRLNELQLNEETHMFTIFADCTALSNIHIEKGNKVYSSIAGVLTDVDHTTILYCPAARFGSYTIPLGIEAIGARAFYECTRLTEIVIPGYVERIEEEAFYGCEKVALLTFSAGAGAGTETVVGDSAFRGMSGLREIKFAEGSAVSSLGSYAFAGAVALRNLMIPASMTSIGDYAFNGASLLASVTFEENGKDLVFGNYVFNDCERLTEVNLPSTVVQLNLGVFDGCVNIANIEVSEDNAKYKDIDGVVFTKDGSELLFFPKGRMTETGEYDIPEGVTKIAEVAFKGTRYITTIVIDNTITEIGASAFESSSLRDLTFAEGNDAAKLTIGASAFAGCSGITALTLPARTESLGDKAFYQVRGIKSIAFPEGLKSIGNYAFSNTGLAQVTIPANLEAFGEFVFDSCAALTSVTFADGFASTIIPAGSFQGTAISSITIPGTVEKVGYAAFNNCVSLRNVTFADGTADLILGFEAQSASDSGSGKDDGKDDGKEEKGKEEGGSIVTGVFMGCINLSSINIPDRTIYIGKSAFEGCTGLRTVNISENSKLQRFDDRAFYNCKALTSIYIPKTVENTPYVNEETSQEYAIGDMAFYDAGLTSVTFAPDGTGDLSIGNEAFANYSSSMKTFTYPARLAPIYVIEYGYGYMYEALARYTSPSSVTAVNIEEGGKYYYSIDGVVYMHAREAAANYEAKVEQLMFLPSKKTGEITIPKTVELIANGAASSSGLTAVYFEDKDNADLPALTIASSVFSNSASLVTVELPERLKEIGSSAFSSCTKLKSIYLPANLETLGNAAFNKCSALVDLVFADDSKLQAIPNNAFYECYALVGETLDDGTTQIRIPASVESIGTYAFGGLYNKQMAYTKVVFEEDSKLTKIEYGAFRNGQFKDFVVPDSVTSITGDIWGYTTYSYCPVETITLPAGLTSIPSKWNNSDGAFFGGCFSLTAVYIDDSNPYFKSVDGVLYSKNGDTLIYYPTAKPISETVTVVDGETGEANEQEISGKYTIPADVTTINAYAFYYNKKLTDLTITKDLLFIEMNAFYYSSIKNITFEERNSPLSVGKSAFQGTKITGSLTIPATLKLEGSYEFASTAISEVVFEEGNQTVNLNNTFYNCTSLRKVTGIPSTASTLTRTFYGCAKLTDVTFESGAYVSAMDAAFYNCSALKSIELPGVGALSVSATYGSFQNCTSLETVTFSEGLGSIGYKAFYGCTSLKELEMPNTCATLGKAAFQNCTSLETVVLSTALEMIPDDAFNNCTSLTSIDIPDLVVSIGTNAFYNCINITSVTLSDGLISVGNNAFNGPTQVAELELPDTLETIGNNAFINWEKVEVLNFPASMKSIGDSAFSGATSLATIRLQDGIESIGNYAFDGCANVTTFDVPASLTTIGAGVFRGWSSLEGFWLDESNVDFALKDGILYNATLTEMIAVPPKVSGDIVIPSTVLALADGVFAGTKITSLVLPDTLTTIGPRAFRGCTELKSVTLPKYLVTIGEAAFEGCTSLESITIPATVKSTFKTEAFTDGKGDDIICMGFYLEGESYGTDPNAYESDKDGIGRFAFANCISLKSVVFEEGGTERLSLGDFAFYNCKSLTSINIPNRVRGDAIPSNVHNSRDSFDQTHSTAMQGIGMYCFASCTSLESVVFEETGAATFSERLIIQLGAFMGCTSLKNVAFNSALGNITKSTGGMKGSEGTTWAIQAKAFDYCTALTNVTFQPTDYPISVAGDAFCTDVKLPSNFNIVVGCDDGYAGTAFSSNFYLTGCASCAGQGEVCNFYDPVQAGVVEAVDPLRLVQSELMEADNQTTTHRYIFNGMWSEYSVGTVKYNTNMNPGSRPEFDYVVTDYDETTKIVSLVITGRTNVSNKYTGKSYYATVDITDPNNAIFTIGEQIDK